MTIYCEDCGRYISDRVYEAHCVTCSTSDGNVLDDYITINSQVNSKNLKEFLRDHHSSPNANQGLLRRYRQSSSQQSRHGGDYERNILLAERIGWVERGVDDIDKVSTEHKENIDGACAICQEDFDMVKRPQKVRRLLCGHMFCACCIERWLEKNRRCPVCMAELV